MALYIGLNIGTWENLDVFVPVRGWLPKKSSGRKHVGKAALVGEPI
jgi:hypothetical protein